MLVNAMSRFACRARVASRLQIMRCMSIGDEYAKKEKVEEQRYIQEQEKEFYKKKRAERAAAEYDNEMAAYAEFVAPAMVEIQEMLKKSSDSVSDAGLETIAKWKLNMKN